MDNYIVISFVGEGSFGRVFKAKHKDTDAVVALKVIRKKGRSSKDLKNLRQECDIQRQLNHPNIIRMIDSFDTESELVVVTEYAEKELHGILAKEGCLSEDNVKKITWDLVSALYYLHSHRVLHRDLKPQNVLLDSTGRAKLCDFGLARIMTNATHILTSIKGTPLYMAPELIDEKPYDHQADLWSLGCIVYELMAGQPPFCTMSIWQLVRMIRHKPVQWPSFISPDARSFLQGLLHKDPVKRMSWPEILEHPFIAGHVLILPEDKQSNSPFTKPLSCSQQEAKFLQTEKMSKNTKCKMEKHLFDHNVGDNSGSAGTTKIDNLSALKKYISSTDTVFSVHNIEDGRDSCTFLILYESDGELSVNSNIPSLTVASHSVDNEESLLKIDSTTVLNPETGLFENTLGNEDKEALFLNKEREIKAQTNTDSTTILPKKGPRCKTHTNTPLKQSRKRKARPETWEKNKIIKNNLKRHVFQSIPDCRCNCRKKLNERAARSVFERFINFQSHTEQNMYLQSCLQELAPQRSRPRNSGRETSRSRRVFKYFVNTRNRTVELCQKAFVSIHGIKKDRLESKVKHREKDIQDGRGRHSNHTSYDEETIENVRNFIENLPARDTYSTRSGNKCKKYLDSNLTVAEIHRTNIKTASETKFESREHDMRNVRGVMQAMECVPMSDDDSVRATSAFSVRDSLKTDDEDQSQPITAANAKLLRHEFNIMNNSNLVVCNLEKNMAQLMAANQKHDFKMHKIDEEKNDPPKECPKSSDVGVVDKKDDKQKPKSTETASQSLENPKSSTKCSSDVSSGLSKSVPPSYKQKLLQFSREKLRFGSGGNRLTRSIKRSFHFSRSIDKNKDTQRRISEPTIEIPSIVEKKDDSIKYCKEDKDKDVEKCEIIHDTTNDKEIANNDCVMKPEESLDVKEPSIIELEEWEAFLNSNITEVMDGDVESLTQLNMVSMVVGVVGVAARSGRGARVCGAVAALLALPALSHSLPRHTLLNIQDVYLEAKVVYNFVAAINTLMRDSKHSDEGAEDRVQGVGRMVEVCAWLCVRSCRAVRQVATALAAYDAHPVFTYLLTSHSMPRIGLNIVGILITVLQGLPEHADVVEKILFDDEKFNFLRLLEQPSDALKIRVCILISLLCTFSCTAFSAAMESKWTKKESESLEALHSHCNVTLNRAARLATKELSNMPFYSS
ncbi:unnamed protein product, partial [Brenthis ino]